jgi:leucyl aminopeptidase
VKKTVAIVGKGLTFDSGGYNLKAGAGSMIEMMKVGGRASGRAGLATV